MHVSPEKHSYVWLPRKCDYRRDGRTDRRRTKWSLCATLLHRRHKNNVSGHILLAFFSHYCPFPSNSCHVIMYSSQFARHTRMFRVGKFWRKWRLEGVLNFHRVLFSLFQGPSMKTYSRVYFSLCLLLAISGRSRTQRILNPREKFPIYGIFGHTDHSRPWGGWRSID